MVNSEYTANEINHASKLEVVKPLPQDYKVIKAVIFDFDGTLSTLRQGWEEVMEPLMLEMICKDAVPPSELVEEVSRYIDESTGIQTIYQMKWLTEAVKRWGYHTEYHDEWWYKELYNERLLTRVKERVNGLLEGRLAVEDFLIKGSMEFLQRLKHLELSLYVASGTDHADVVKEVRALKLSDYFKDIAGAPYRKVSCSKEAVIKNLINQKGYKGSELLIIGDGKVEIALGNEANSVTLGLATNEVKREGTNEVKRSRLLKAGCHALTGDFNCYDKILSWLNLV